MSEYNTGITIVDYNDTSCSVEEEFKLTYSSNSLVFEDLTPQKWEEVKPTIAGAKLYYSLGPPCFRLIFVTDGRDSQHPALIRSARLLDTFADLKHVHDYYREHNTWPGMRQDGKYIYGEQRSSLDTFTNLLIELDEAFFAPLLE